MKGRETMKNFINLQLHQQLNIVYLFHCSDFSLNDSAKYISSFAEFRFSRYKRFMNKEQRKSFEQLIRGYLEEKILIEKKSRTHEASFFRKKYLLNVEFDELTLDELEENCYFVNHFDKKDLLAFYHKAMAESFIYVYRYFYMERYLSPPDNGEDFQNAIIKVLEYLSYGKLMNIGYITAKRLSNNCQFAHRCNPTKLQLSESSLQTKGIQYLLNNCTEVIEKGEVLLSDKDRYYKNNMERAKKSCSKYMKFFIYNVLGSSIDSMINAIPGNDEGNFFASVSNEYCANAC